jgi:trans-aconitate methyltransferase
MVENEFDQYAEKYGGILDESLLGSTSKNSNFTGYKIKLISRLLSWQVFERMLDFGCGAYRGTFHIKNYFPDSSLRNCDVSKASLGAARNMVPDTTLVSDLKNLKDERFDIIVAENEFHYIATGESVRVLPDCREQLTDYEAMFIFDDNAFNHATRWIFECCSFGIYTEALSKGSASKVAMRANLTVSDGSFALFSPVALSFLRGLEKSLKSFLLGEAILCPA